MTATSTQSAVQDATDSDLPNGWVRVDLAEVCEINPSKPPANAMRSEAPVTFVPMPAVDAKQGAITNAQTRLFAAVRKGYTAFRNGDVIMAKITPCMENGKAAIARNLQNGLGFGSTEFHVFRPTQAILSEFIYYFIRQESYRKQAESEMTGSVGQKRVPAQFIERTRLALPPFAEQQRIVAKLEELLERAHGADEHLAKLPPILTTFRQSVLAAACSGRLTGDWREMGKHLPIGAELLTSIARPEDSPSLTSDDGFEIPPQWVWASLEQCCQVQRGRFSIRPRNDPRYYDGPYPFVQIGDLPANGGDILNYSQTLNTDGLNVSRLFEKGTILIAIVGATIGNTGLLTFEACCPDSLVAISSKAGVSNRYVEYYLRWRKLSVREESYASGGQPNINLQTLRPYPVPLPPTAEQKEIVRRVEALFKLADAIEKRVAAAQARADNLTQSILAKAFRGELVPTEAELARQEGREYEPASVLLERIRVNRASATSQTDKVQASAQKTTNTK